MNLPLLRGGEGIEISMSGNTIEIALANEPAILVQIESKVRAVRSLNPDKSDDYVNIYSFDEVQIAGEKNDRDDSVADWLSVYRPPHLTRVRPSGLSTEFRGEPAFPLGYWVNPLFEINNLDIDVSSNLIVKAYKVADSIQATFLKNLLHPSNNGKFTGPVYVFAYTQQTVVTSEITVVTDIACTNGQFVIRKARIRFAGEFISMTSVT